MSEQEKWLEASAAWSEVKRGVLSNFDFWAIIHELAAK